METNDIFLERVIELTFNLQKCVCDLFTQLLLYRWARIGGNQKYTETTAEPTTANNLCSHANIEQMQNDICSDH